MLSLGASAAIRRPRRARLRGPGHFAYVQNQILSTEPFYTLMFTAFWLNVAVPVTIPLWKPNCDAEPPSDYVAPPERPDIREMTPEET